MINFETPNTIVINYSAFESDGFAFEALNKEGNMACVVNAANEVAVEAFLKDKIKFLQMSDVIEECVKSISFLKNPSYNDYVETDKLTRIKAWEKVDSL